MNLARPGPGSQERVVRQFPDVDRPTVLPRKCHAKGCGALVYDLRHVGTGRMAAIDAAPSDVGNIQIDLEAGTYSLPGRDFRFDTRPLYVNHYATCAFAQKFRGRRVGR
jgi:hypothetical protein